MNEWNTWFYQNPYQKEFDAVVLSCEKKEDGWAIRLDNTAFYPEGGGQPSDQGTLNGIAVLEVRKDDGPIFHRTQEPLPIGARVHGILDWRRRFDHMQQHTGEHIFSGLVHRRYGYDNIGFHMNEERVTIDFNGPLAPEAIVRLEQEANAVIYADKEILVSYCSALTPPSEYRSKKKLHGDIRLITIPDVDCCACCGTHVARTGEVGMLKVTHYEKHPYGVRVNIVCGKRAWDYCHMLQGMNTKISQLLSVEPFKTERAVFEQAGQLAKVNQSLRFFQHAYMDEKLAALPRGEKIIVTVVEAMDIHVIHQFCNRSAIEKDCGIAVVLWPEGETYRYCMISKVMDLREWIREANLLLHGRGGGSQDMVQGSFRSDQKTIESVLHRLAEKVRRKEC